ncbi:MAG: hypothetical protein H7836_12425 [Magnetococcus sp. YQC-3]
MAIIKSHQEKSINEVINTVIGTNIQLQLAGVDVAKPFIQGKPGGGKTASLVKMCKDAGWNIFHLHLPLIPLEDLSGLPDFFDIQVNGEAVRGTKWTFPEILTEIYKLSQDTVVDPKTKKEYKKPCIVFLDDMHLASPGHLALGFELFSERKLRTFKIPENVAFVLAGNASAKAGTKTQNSAILNRLAVFPVNTSFEYWRNNYAYPNNVNSKILAFLSKDTYQQFFHEEETVNSPWGSPRAWTYLSNMMNVLESRNNGEISQSDLSYLAAGHVSGTATSEFVNFYHIYSKTQMDLVFEGKIGVSCPEDELTKYVYMIAASNEFINRTKKTEIKEVKDKILDKICEIISVIGEANSEICLSGVKHIVDMEKSLQEKSGNNETSYSKIATRLKVTNTAVSKKISSDLLKISGNK